MGDEEATLIGHLKTVIVSLLTGVFFNIYGNILLQIVAGGNTSISSLIWLILGILVGVASAQVLPSKIITVDTTTLNDNTVGTLKNRIAIPAFQIFIGLILFFIAVVGFASVASLYFLIPIAIFDARLSIDFLDLLAIIPSLLVLILMIIHASKTTTNSVLAGTMSSGIVLIFIYLYNTYTDFASISTSVEVFCIIVLLSFITGYIINTEFEIYPLEE